MHVATTAVNRTGDFAESTEGAAVRGDRGIVLKTEMGSDSPEGVKLRWLLRGHKDRIARPSWDPNSLRVASGSDDGTVKIWNAETGGLLRTLSGNEAPIGRVAWSSDGRLLAAGAADGTVWIWRAGTGALLRKEVLSPAPRSWTDFVARRALVRSVDWRPGHNRIAIASDDYTVRLLDIASGTTELLCTAGDRVTSVAYSPDGKLLAAGDDTGEVWVLRPTMTLKGPTGHALEVAWSPSGKLLATAHSNGIILIRSIVMGLHTIAVLEGHEGEVGGLSFSADGKLLASKSDRDNTIRFWNCESWECLAVLPEEGYGGAYLWHDGLAFHPKKPLLATLGEHDTALRIWDVDASGWSRQAVRSVHYKNARVVLVGDSGVGKTALWMRLGGDEFTPTESTHGRQVKVLESERVARGGRHEERELLLWDLAGQPGYRLTHQLHLHEANAAVVVFDSRSETEALAGVEYWGRVLRHAQTGEIKRLLVAARKDRGGLASSRERIEKLRARLGFTEFLETSARTGEGIAQLREAIRSAIDWDSLIPVSSTELFGAVKRYIEGVRAIGRLLVSESDLRREYGQAHGQLGEQEFHAAMRALETHGAIRCLNFGGLVLLSPEVLDAYASAISVAAKQEPDGLGHLPEEQVLRGEFDLERRLRLESKEQERLVLIATVNEMLRSEVALREHSPDGAWLVFPSQITRPKGEAAPEGAGCDVWFTFEGPVETIYATLIVRLSHSGICRRAEMWSNGARFESIGGGNCELRIVESDTGCGSMELTFRQDTVIAIRAAIEEYVRAHLERRAAPGSVRRHRAWMCGECGTPVTETQAEKRRLRGFQWISCGVCETRIDLTEPGSLEQARQESVPEMDRSANQRRGELVAESVLRGKQETADFDVFLAHSTQDKPAVRELAECLRKRGLNPWVDEEQVPPGRWFQDVIQAAIPRVRSAAVLVGRGGIGRWEAVELRSFLSLCVERGLALIPVLLPGVDELPEDYAFLRQLNYVRFRASLDDPAALAKLQWGITGTRG